jgi:surface antigen
LCLLTTFAAAGAWAADAAKFVSENYQDNTSVAGGTTFTKTWTIKNSGTTTWTSSYKLKYVSGDLSSSHSSVAISGTVKPGNNYTFSVAMKAPAVQSSAKTYREDWKFTNSSGSTVKVGNSSTIWAQIVVPKAVVADDYGDSCSKAADISINSSKNGKIDFAGDNDYFRVQVPSKGTLTVYTTGSTDTYGRLFDSACKELTTNNDDNGNVNFKIARSVSAAGTYYVAVRHNSSTKTGSYVVYANLAPQAPTLIAPADGTKNVSKSSSVTFRWNDSLGATNYRIVISQNNSFSGFNESSMKCDGTCFTTTTSATNHVSSSRELSGHTYYWRVRANGAGGASEWSKAWQFTTAGNTFPAVNWDSLAYRTNNIFWAAGYAPKRFYSNNISPNLGDAKGNCTWYAHGRLKELGYDAKKLKLMSGNAAYWKTQAVSGGISVSSTPMQGDIAQATANYGIYTSYGHVAVVEEVYSNGTLLISESSYAPKSATWNFEYRAC